MEAAESDRRRLKQEVCYWKPSPTPAKRKISCKRRRFFILKHNALKACMDSKRNERAEQRRRQNRTDAVLVNAAAVKGAHTMCATVTASPTPAIDLIPCKAKGFFILNQIF